jgi:cytidylate kinase
LRVRVVAPLELRVQTLASEENLSLDQARARVKAADAERSAFIRHVFKKDAGSPLNHDIVINTGEISVESATQIVLGMLEKKLGIPRTQPPTV